MAEIVIVKQSVEKAHIWLNEMADELGTDDRQEAYRILRTEASYAVSSAAKILQRHVSSGEIDDVRAILPDDLKVIVS